VAARNAEALDAAGNRIDVGASEAAAAANARALAIVDALALRKGNAVNEIFNRAAQRLADGEPLARVVRDTVAELRGLDLDRAILEDGGSGRPAGGSGRDGFAESGDGAARGDADPDELTPATLDELEAEGQAGFALFDDTAHKAFDDPSGAGIQAVADSAWHDLKAGQELTAKASETGASGAKPGGAVIGAKLAAWIEEDPARARREYEALPETDGGRIINTDSARELSGDYRADRSRSSEVHEAASAFTKAHYTAKLAEPVPAGRDRLVLFTGGGTGAGKSSGLKLIASADRAGLIYNTNMNTLASAVAKIEQALAAGWPVEVVYTWRDPIEALAQGTLPRAEKMGRTVPLDVHIETHLGARQVVAELAQRYANDDRVMVRVVDNSHGKGNARVVPLETIPSIDELGLYDTATATVEAAYRSGAIGDATLRGALGERAQGLRQAAQPGSGRAGAGDGGRPQPPGDGGQRLDPEPLFDLDDGKGPRPLAAIEAELKNLDDGLAAMRECLA
jgi:hypothetical protein